MEVTAQLHLAPPYHVQSTAAELRDGFPYFTHHDSVSALWSQKWRRPCAAGIYPFYDGKVEDFDPIFAELVDISGDDTAILYRPDDYAKPFFPTAQRLVYSAEGALDDGDTATARNLFLRAAAVYRIARFPINRSPLSQDAWNRGKAAYERGGKLLDPPSTALNIPFTRADPAAGDSDRPIPAYLRIPAGDPPNAGWPLVLFICGLDAYRTDNTPRTQIHLEHGFATLSFEIPGTGDCPASPRDPASPDRWISSILDWVTFQADMHRFDVNTIVARGISTGGYYAFRVAHTHADHLVAVAAQGGGCHHMMDPDWIGAQNQMEYPFALSDALAYKFGFRDADPTVARTCYAAEAHKFSLVASGLVQTPSTRLLVLNGMEDSIFPIEDSILASANGRHKDLIARADLHHMGNPGGEDIVYQWIDNVVAARQ